MPRSGRDVMWSEALAMLARTDRLHQEAFRPTSVGWEPPVDVLETETELLVVVALPGVRRDEMEIVIGRGELTVRGTRGWLSLGPSLGAGLGRPARVHRIELPHGRFERSLPLPAGTYQLAGQEYTDGCLIITLRRLG